MKNITAIVVMLLSSMTAAVAKELPEFPFIYVGGSAEKEVPPDMATITFTVEVQDSKPEAALDVVYKRGVELIALFKEMGIPEHDFETYNIDKQYRKDDENQKISGYEVTQRFKVKLRGLTHYIPLYENLLKMKNVVDINADFDIVKRKEIEANLMAEACADAKKQAENMANGIGVKLGSVYGISKLSFDAIGDRLNAPGYFKKSMMGGDDRSSSQIIFAPATIMLRNSVNVIYKIENQR